MNYVEDFFAVIFYIIGLSVLGAGSFLFWAFALKYWRTKP